MENTKISTFAARLREGLRMRGLNQAALAAQSGVSKSSITHYVKGDWEAKQSAVYALAKTLNVSEAWLMGYDAPMERQEDKEPRYQNPIPRGFQPMPELVKVPRVGRIACGSPILAEENIERTDTIPAYLHADYTLLCVGDSMAPKFLDGDVVCIRTQPEVENGEVAAVRIDDEATLKQVFLHDDFIELRPLNSEYQSIIRAREAMNDVSIEGKAVGLIRKV